MIYQIFLEDLQEGQVFESTRGNVASTLTETCSRSITGFSVFKTPELS